MMTRASTIIPAYNEAERISAVIAPLQAAQRVGEIIVVDDDSTDGTAEISRRLNVKVIKMHRNMGKAAALDRGVREAQNDLLLFLDADLVGLQASHIDLLISLYEEKNLDMLVGVFKNGRLNTDIAQTIAPYLSGQRVLRRKHWNKLRESGKLEFGVEMALTKLSIKENWVEERVFLEGVTHVMKEKKRGFSQGFIERIHMYGDILRSLFTRVS
jgi:glycosyltransferase involved in cell wall biosynthesis